MSAEYSIAATLGAFVGLFLMMAVAEAVDVWKAKRERNERGSRKKGTGREN